jgi:hypothetical protein
MAEFKDYREAAKRRIEHYKKRRDVTGKTHQSGPGGKNAKVKH